MADARSRLPGLAGAECAAGLLLLGLLVALALLGGLLDLPPPERMNLLARLAPPAPGHPLGTDHLGRDVLARLVAAAPLSLGAAAAAMAAILGLALPWGLAAALVGGRVDGVLMRLADIVAAFPTLVLALAVIGFMGASLEAAVIGVAAGWWPGVARLVRALTLSAMERPFVKAARLAGASRGRTVLRHVLPQIAPPLAVAASLETASVLLALSALSFLGLGAQPPTPEWGAMLNEARPFLAQAPHMLIAPGVAVTLAVLGFNLLGEGLRAMLDERRPYRW